MIPIFKVEHHIKHKIQDPCKNRDKTTTTKAAHNKILGETPNKSNPAAVTEVIKDYVRDSEAYENSQDALSHMVKLKKS